VSLLIKTLQISGEGRRQSPIGEFITGPDNLCLEAGWRQAPGSPPRYRFAHDTYAVLHILTQFKWCTRNRPFLCITYGISSFIYSITEKLDCEQKKTVASL